MCFPADFMKGGVTAVTRPNPNYVEEAWDHAQAGCSPRHHAATPGSMQWGWVGRNEDVRSPRDESSHHTQKLQHSNHCANSQLTPLPPKKRTQKETRKETKNRVKKSSIRPPTLSLGSVGASWGFESPKALECSQSSQGMTGLWSF
jgi:hypothetical protein